MSPTDGQFQPQLARACRLLTRLAQSLVYCLAGCCGVALLAATSDGTDSIPVLLGQKQDANAQYCFYQKLQDSDDSASYRLLTPNSLAKSDLIAAARSESVNMSRALNFAGFAVFPAGLACGSTALIWLGVRRRFGYVTLLSCSALAALVVSAKQALAAEEVALQQALDELLAGEQQPSKYHTELFRVLRWLGSDEAIACPQQPRS